MRLAAGDPTLWPVLAGRHAERLRRLGRGTLALRRAMALGRQLRYEEAFEVLLRGIFDHDLDPALRWPAQECGKTDSGG